MIMAGSWLRISAERVIRHPLRSGLVTLTFALGLASVVSIVGTIEGGKKAIRHDLEALGTDLIAMVNPLRLGSVAIGKPTTGQPIGVDHLEKIDDRLAGITDSVSPLRVDLGLTSFAGVAWRHTMVSTTPGFRSVLRPGMLVGRFLQAQDQWPTVAEGVVPAAIDEALAAKFFADPSDALGVEFRSIREGKAFTVRIVGVVNDPLLLRKHMSSFDATSRARSIPARRLEFLNLYLPWRSTTDLPTVVLIDTPSVDDVDLVLEKVLALVEEEQLGVYVHVQKRWTAVVLEILDRFSGLGHFIWILDLVVVLILTGTISLLAIDESIEEVAIRRAEGATVLAVMMPVFLEGAFLAMLAMPLGIYLGIMILENGIEPVLGWASSLPVETVTGTCLALLVTSILASILPAIRVARLEPASVLGRRRDL
ncbi:MAG: ABC transporter permease [Planctomycetota bacterium]|nr:ABC transporter permease [Planctomycetota bacterium]